MSDSGISVVIPTFNRAEDCREAIHSVQDQTEAPDEIIVVDDASTDSTGRVVQSMADSRIKYLRHNQNLGGASARNTGVEHATGEMIGFLDSDDKWRPNKLERQLGTYDSHPNSVAVYCNSMIEDIDTGSKNVASQPNYSGDVYAELLRGWCPTTTSAFLVEKEAIQSVGGFDERFASFQDYDLWIQLARVGEFSYVDEPLVIRRVGRGDQITNSATDRRSGLNMLFEKWEDEIIRIHDKETANRFYRKRLAQTYWLDFVNHLERGERIDAIRDYLKFVSTVPDRTWIEKTMDVLT